MELDELVHDEFQVQVASEPAPVKTRWSKVDALVLS